MVKCWPGAMPRRCAAPSESHAPPGGGAPTSRPPTSLSRPTSGQFWSTAFSSMGAVVSPKLAMACIRLPCDSLP